MDRMVRGRFDLQLNIDMARHGYSLSMIKKEMKIKVRFLNLIIERKVIYILKMQVGSVGLIEHWLSIIGVKIEVPIKHAFEISKLQTYTAVHFTENFEQANDFEDTSL